MNWGLAVQEVVTGAAVSWPAVLLGYWLSRKKTAAHVDAVTSAQTAELKRAIAAPPGPDPASPDRLP